VKVLVIGGSGRVGSLVLPSLARRHGITVFDLKPPRQDVAARYIAGSVCDPEALYDAAEGMDVLLYMAMGPDWRRTDDPKILAAWRADHYDVNVKGLHLALFAAHRNGIAHAVFTSSMSVYHGIHKRRMEGDEETPPDADDAYGFTKRLGEEVCRSACRVWGMSVNAMRLCLPVSEEKWHAEVKPGQSTIMTTGEDVARALLAALEYRDGFQAFAISGDYAQERMSLAKARRLLGWEPLARPREPQAEEDIPAP
jgi:nucleoside-diphosphate-sugar epimerase